MGRGLKVLLVKFLRLSLGLLAVGLVVGASAQTTHAARLLVANNNTDVRRNLENVIGQAFPLTIV